MKKYLFIINLLTALFSVPYLANAQAAKVAAVKISGEVTTALEVKPSDFEQYPQTEVKRKDRDGNDHNYSGIILAELLKKAGVTLGRDLKGQNLTKYVLVEASDGYQVVFA